MIEAPEKDKPRARIASETRKHVGYLKEDLPNKQGNVTAARKAGANAYLKPNVTVPSTSVRYKRGLTPEQAHGLGLRGLGQERVEPPHRTLERTSTSPSSGRVTERLVGLVETGKCSNGTTVRLWTAVSRSPVAASRIFRP